VNDLTANITTEVDLVELIFQRWFDVCTLAVISQSERDLQLASLHDFGHFPGLVTAFKHHRAGHVNL